MPKLGRAEENLFRQLEAQLQKPPENDAFVADIAIASAAEATEQQLPPDEPEASDSTTLDS